MSFIDKITGSKLATLQTEMVSLKEANAKQVADLQAKITELTIANEAKSIELDQAKKAANEITEANIKLAEQVVELKTKVETTEASVEAKASDKAIDIVAGQGIAPIAQTISANPASESGNILEQFNAIKDPAEKTAFFRKNSDKIKAIALK